MRALKTSQKYFDYKAITWDEVVDSDVVIRLNEIFENILPKLKSPILDVGSGTGVLVPLLQHFAEEINQVFEFDVSLNMLTTAKEKYGKFNNIEYIQGDAHTLPCTTNYFNSVICFAVFPHLYNHTVALEEFCRVLKPGGLFVILHLMDHIEINTKHNYMGKAIKNDLLKPVREMTEQVKEKSFKVIKSLERKDLYLIIARKI